MTDLPGQKQRRRRPATGAWRGAPLLQGVLLVAMLLGGGLRAGQPEAVEQQTLKAAYLCHFLALTRWPAPSAPLVLGIYGTSKAGDELAAILPPSVGGLAIKIVRLPTEGTDWGSVNAVFIPATYQSEVPGLIRRMGAAPVLIIGESPNFAAEGGVIGFVPEGNKLRFEINQGAATKRRLQLSAKLLELAKSILR